MQNQCGASPADPTDPELRAWVKDASNPLTSFAIPSPGGTRLQWRDPTAGLQLPGGAWLVVIGAQVGCRGAAAVYTSPDFSNWTYDGLLSEQDSSAGLPTLDVCSQCARARGRACVPVIDSPFRLNEIAPQVWRRARPRPHVGVPRAVLAGQRRPLRVQIRCAKAVDVAPPPSIRAIFNPRLTRVHPGDQQAKRARFASDFYQVGTLESSPDAGYKFVPSGPAPKNIDGGAVYASQAMDAGSGRRVLFAWAMECVVPRRPILLRRFSTRLASPSFSARRVSLTRAVLFPGRSPRRRGGGRGRSPCRASWG